MTVILWVLLAIILVILVIWLTISMFYSRRVPLTDVHTPSDYGLKFEPVEFKAKDGITLRGEWIPVSGSDKAIVILHGYHGSHDRDLWRVPALHEAGFNTLLFDFRAHGRSDGKWMTFGHKERWDVLAAIEFLHRRDIYRIGLLGFSYGGLISILTAAISPDVKAVITDGGPNRWMMGATGWARERGLPVRLVKSVAWVFFGITSIFMGANLFKYELVHWVGKISPRPILFIHGDLDLYCTDFDDLYAAAGEPKELWRLPDVGHSAASQLYPEEHARRVIDFFTRYL